MNMLYIYMYILYHVILGEGIRWSTWIIPTVQVKIIYSINNLIKILKMKYLLETQIKIQPVPGRQRSTILSY